MLQCLPPKLGCCDFFDKLLILKFYFAPKVEIRIKIPEELKSYIVDDWAQICRKKRLTILPARLIKFT